VTLLLSAGASLSVVEEHDYINKPFFVTNLDKINIFSLSLIRKSKQDATLDA
jgi:hypothetical protein